LSSHVFSRRVTTLWNFVQTRSPPGFVGCLVLFFCPVTNILQTGSSNLVVPPGRFRFHFFFPFCWFFMVPVLDAQIIWGSGWTSREIIARQLSARARKPRRFFRSPQSHRILHSAREDLALGFTRLIGYGVRVSFYPSNPLSGDPVPIIFKWSMPIWFY